jgi:hypothetical protein
VFCSSPRRVVRSACGQQNAKGVTEMRRLKLVLAASAGLLIAAAAYGTADAAMPTPAPHRHAVVAVRDHHPPPGYRYHWNNHWYRHRVMRHHHWHYY